MIILKHRCNSIQEIDSKYGAEIDVRDHNGKLVLSHGLPNDKSVELTTYLKIFPKKTLLAINVKSCEIEAELKRILDKSRLEQYFVFDFSFPYLKKAQQIGLTCAFRLSEYEKDIQSSCDWVWIDSFDKVWYDENYLRSLRKHDLRIAIVSPDIHNRNNENEFSVIKQMASSNLIDTICTNEIDIWND